MKSIGVDFLSMRRRKLHKKGNKLKRPTSKLKVWTPEIQAAVRTKKVAFHKWKQAGRPEDTTNRAVQEKKLATISLHRAITFESSKKYPVQTEDT